METQERQHVSLLQLQTIIKNRLELEMPLSAWVTAEISELSVNYSGHCYMELVEKGGKNQVPSARVSAVIWRNSFGAINSYFLSATGIELGKGLNVLLRVKVIYHEVYGLSLNVTDIDPLYTLGDMEQQRQATIEKLKVEGVYDMNRMLAMPDVVQRVAVLSSRNAAGYQDFMNELDGSPYRFSTTLFDSFMQGAATEGSVIGALEKIAERMEEFDIVVVIRGGGSQSDLAAFDSYRLCSHLAQFPMPIITGIGHDRDESVADLVASVALKTPTAVAGWLIDGLEEVDEYLMQLRGQVFESGAEVLSVEGNRIKELAYRLMQGSLGLTHTLDLRLERLSGELRRRHGVVLLKQQNRIDAIFKKLKEGSKTVFAQKKSRLKTASLLIDGRRVERILSLGFAIVSHGGSALRSASQLNVGDMLGIQLSEGRVEAKVVSKSKSENKDHKVVEI